MSSQIGKSEIVQHEIVLEFPQEKQKQRQQQTGEIQPNIQDDKKKDFTIGKLADSKARMGSESDAFINKFTGSNLKMQSKIQLDADKRDQTISYVKLQEKIKTTHPTNSEHSFYTCNEVCCLSSGYHKIFNSTKESEFNKFGVGISLYFKFVKYLTFWFLIFTIISFPMILIYVSVATQQQSYEFQSFDSILYATTIGALSEQFCLYATIPETSTSADNVAFKCQNDALIEIQKEHIQFGLMKTSTSQSCLFIDEDQYNTSCLYEDSIISTIQYECANKSECSFLINKQQYFRDDGSN